jgi:serine/threonine protein kinase
MQKSVLQRTALVSGLVTQEQLDQALAAARQPDLGPPAPRVEVTDDQLARQLVQLRIVTAYQAEQLKAGRSKLTLGPYVITDWIAQGGMGQVFKAEHQLMGREVAIKVLPQSRSTPSSIANFTREIRTQAILDHENLVRAFDAGHDGNVYYLVTEFIRGTDLRRLVRMHGRLNHYQGAALISQAAAGLQSAHDKGLIHRDVKPGNILVTLEGRAKVSDLGLAAFLYEYNDPQVARIVGTADYISPEQIRTPENVTTASDIYSLGCTLYYAVTGKVPFPGGTTRDKARRHCEETPWHPRRFNPELTEEFVEVIADMMEKEPADRIASAADVITRLEPWAREAIPLRLPQSRRFWMPPPPPSSAGDDDLQATVDGSYDSLDAGSAGTAESSSQSTDPLHAAAEDTLGEPKQEAPAVPMENPADLDRTWSAISFALMIAIPIAMLVGSLATLVAMLLLK